VEKARVSRRFLIAMNRHVFTWIKLRPHGPRLSKHGSAFKMWRRKCIPPSDTYRVEHGDADDMLNRDVARMGAKDRPAVARRAAMDLEDFLVIVFTF